MLAPCACVMRRADAAARAAVAPGAVGWREASTAGRNRRAGRSALSRFERIGSTGAVAGPQPKPPCAESGASVRDGAGS
jgi:hypothetical protein